MKSDRTIGKAGNVVERYIFDPYGRTEIATVTFYHDHDLDGDIDAADVAHYDWCTSSGFPERAQDPMCVFVHNRNGDYELTAADGTLFAAYVASPSYNSNGAPPPEEWERLRTAFLDANNDQVINLYDWYGFQVCEGVSTTTGGMNDHLCLFLYDLDGDGDVDLNEGQQGCNLFTGQWSTAGDGRPGQATGSRFGNPFMWTAQRYDAPVGLYHFLFRSYSPTLGRWLQRDPLGYVNSLHLLQYVASAPLNWIDPLGLQYLDTGLAMEMVNAEARQYAPPIIRTTRGSVSVAVTDKRTGTLRILYVEDNMQAVLEVFEALGITDIPTDISIKNLSDAEGETHRVTGEITLDDDLFGSRIRPGNGWEDTVGKNALLVNLLAVLVHEMGHANNDTWWQRVWSREGVFGYRREVQLLKTLIRRIDRKRYKDAYMMIRERLDDAKMRLGLEEMWKQIEDDIRKRRRERCVLFII